MKLEFPAGLALYPYQQDDLDAWVALPKPRVLWNCHQLSLGKTVDGVVCAKACAYDRILVVASKSMRPEWQAEFEKWWPERELAAEIDRGFARKAMSVPEHFRLQALIDNRTHICSPELLHKLVKLHEDAEPADIGAYDYIIVDEFHEIRSWWSQTFQALLRLRRMYPRADFKALSGTPMGSDPLKAWPWLKLSEPHKWGNLRKGEDVPFLFRKQWGVERESEYSFSGFSYSGVNQERLQAFAKLVAHLIRRKTAGEVGLQLPPMRFEIKRYPQTDNAEDAAADWAASAVLQQPVMVLTHNIAEMDRIQAALQAREVRFIRLFQEQTRNERATIVREALAAGQTVILATTGLVSTGVNYLADIKVFMLAQPCENPVEIQQLSGRFARLSSEDKSPRVGFLLYREGEEFSAQKALASRLLTDRGIVLPSADALALEEVIAGRSKSSFLDTLRLLGRQLMAHQADDDGDEDNRDY